MIMYVSRGLGGFRDCVNEASHSPVGYPISPNSHALLCSEKPTYQPFSSVRGDCDWGKKKPSE